MEPITEFKKGVKEFNNLFGVNLLDTKSTPINSAFKNKLQKQIKSDDVNEILSDGKCKFFDILDKIGVHYNKSRHTRFTAHKTHDFSSIQSRSSLNLQEFYQEVMEASKILEESSYGKDKPLELDNIEDEGVKRKLKALESKIKKESKSLVRLIENNRILFDKFGEILKEINQGKGVTKSKYKEQVRKLSAQFSNNVEFINQNGDRIDDVYGTSYVTSGMTALGIGAIVGFGGLAVSGPFVLLGFGIMVIAAIALMIVAVLLERDVIHRMGIIISKRYVAKIQGKLTSIIKYINESAAITKNYARNLQSGSDDLKINDNVKTVVNDFIGKQKALWEPYISYKDRDYKPGWFYKGMRNTEEAYDKRNIKFAKMSLAYVWAHLTVDLNNIGK